MCTVRMRHGIDSQCVMACVCCAQSTSKVLQDIQLWPVSKLKSLKNENKRARASRVSAWRDSSSHASRFQRAPPRATAERRPRAALPSRVRRPRGGPRSGDPDRSVTSRGTRQHLSHGHAPALAPAARGPRPVTSLRHRRLTGKAPRESPLALRSALVARTSCMPRSANSRGQLV